MVSATQFFVDGVYLSELGHRMIKGLSIEQQQQPRKKRKLKEKATALIAKEAGIMATIESVVAGGSLDCSLDDSAKLELIDVKEEPMDIYKDGMIWSKADGPVPEGFTLYTTEGGITILRKKRQRNLQKLGKWIFCFSRCLIRLTYMQNFILYNKFV